MHRYINRANTFTLILIDDHSRFVVGHGVDDRERAAMVIRTFEGKKNYGSLPDGADARYLLGIVRNLDAQHEADAITRALLDERLAARDTLLEPLVRRQGELARLGLTQHLRQLVDEAMRDERVLERHSWLGVLADLLREQPREQRRELFRAAARRIHSSFRVHRRERDAAERILARLIWPLA